MVVPLDAHPTTGRAGTINDRVARAEAVLTLARAAIALRRHRLEHGAYPESLDVLPFEPIDPFIGSTIRYQRQGEGFAIGSVGMGPADPLNWVWNR